MEEDVTPVVRFAWTVVPAQHLAERLLWSLRGHADDFIRSAVRAL